MTGGEAIGSPGAEFVCGDAHKQEHSLGRYGRRRPTTCVAESAPAQHSRPSSVFNAGARPMGRRDRSGSVNDTGNSAAGACSSRARAAEDGNIQKRCRPSHQLEFYARARDER